MIDIERLKEKLLIVTFNSELRFLKGERDLLLTDAEMAVNRLYQQGLNHINIQNALRKVNESLYDALTIQEHLTSKEKQIKELKEVLKIKE